MIFCYSASQNSKVYAEVLSGIVDHPVQMLHANMPEPNRLAFAVRAIWSTLTKKAVPIINMPVADNFAGFDEIYICGPIWGGQPAGPLRYFARNIPAKKVHMILTAGLSHVKYATKGKQMLADAGHTPGFVEVFAVNSKEEIERDVIESHIRELMGQI